MVFKGKYKSVKFLDPHFSDDDEEYAPVARFEPTQEGWEWALSLARRL